METSRNLPDEKSEIIDIKCSGAINPNVKEEDRSGPSTEPSLPNCKAGFHQRDSDVSNPAKAENLPKNERGSLSDDEGMIICEILRKIVDQIVEGSSDVKFDPKIETYCADDESPTRKMAEPTARAPRPRTRQSVRQTRANNSHSEVTSKKDTVNGCVVLADEMLVKGCSSVANAMDLTEKLSMQYEGPSGALISVAANDEDHWKRKPPPLTKDRINDPFCWICHKEGVNCDCVVCPRAFHSRCVRSSVPSMSVNEWVCTECRKIMSAEDLDSNDQNSSRLSLDQLCILLQFVIHRLKHSGVDPFLKPVPTSQFPSYKDYIIHPMDLFTLECNIKKKMYGCTYSFLADARWILHNCIVFNGYHNKLTTLAKTLVRICQSEISELDTCPNCYLNTCTKTDDWFSEPCGEPHTMLWAKLKGFPFWPAKAMRILENNVDVRFFGAHDRAWVPIGRCFMYSKEYPVPTKTKKKGFEQAVEEAESYIEKLKSSSGFTYAPSKTAVVPEDIHCPKKFVLDVSCFDRHNFGNSHCVRTNGMMLPRIVGESADLPDSRRSDSPATSYPPMLSIISVSSPSVSPRSDRSSASATPQPLSVSTSSSSQKSDSDSVTFGGNESPDATIGRNVPDGIFDVSPNMKTTMPRKLDVKVPKLDLNLLSRSRSVDQILKLESAMEKIKDISVSNADRVACDAAHDVTTADVPVKETDGERRLDSARVDSVSSPMCEVSSTTLATNDASSCELVQQRRLTNAPVICRSLPFDQSKFMSANKYSSVFAKNLRKTIDNCRAKLGIEPNDDVALVESESDEESIVVTAEIPGDLQRKRLHPDSLLFPGSSSRTTNATNTITDKVVVPYVGLLTTATTANSNGGINCLSTTGTTCTGHHPKRMRLSKIPNHVGANSSGPSAPKLSVVSGENPDDSVATKFVTHSSSMIPSGSTTFRNAFRHQQIISTSVNQEQNSLSNSNGPSCLSLPTTGIISTTDVDKYTSKIMDFMKNTMEEMSREFGGVSDSYQHAAIKALQMEMEMLNLRHQQEIAETTHNARLVMMEMRHSLDIDKKKTIDLLKDCADKEIKEAIEKTKKKQWCANCGKEALFYCCWNTSYCDYKCQHSHWYKHISRCTQQSPVSLHRLNAPTSTEHPNIGSKVGAHLTSGSTNPQNSFVTTNQRFGQMTFANAVASSVLSSSSSTCQVPTVNKMHQATALSVDNNSYHLPSSSSVGNNNKRNNGKLSTSTPSTCNSQIPLLQTTDSSNFGLTAANNVATFNNSATSAGYVTDGGPSSAFK